MTVSLLREANFDLEYGVIVNGYVLILTPDGEYAVWLLRDSSIVTLIPFSSDSVIQAGTGGRNTLQLRIQEKLVTFFINETKVGAAPNHSSSNKSCFFAHDSNYSPLAGPPDELLYTNLLVTTP